MIAESKIIANFPKAQVFFKEKFSYLLKNNIIDYFRSWNTTRWRIFEELVRFDNYYDSIYASQQRIAHNVGCSLRTVNGFISELKKLGLIKVFSLSTHYEGAPYLPNLYRLHPLFYIDSFRFKLRHWIPSFKFFTKATFAKLLLTGFILVEYCVPIISSVLEKDIYFKSLSNRKRDLQLLESGSSAYGKDRSQFFKKNLQREKSRAYMKQFTQSFDGCDNSPVPDYVKEINNPENGVQLSKWGQIEFTRFPREAVLYAIQKIKYSNNIRDPFRFLYSLALQWCKDNNIIPDHRWAEQLIKTYKMPHDAVKFLKVTKKKTPQAPHTPSPLAGKVIKQSPSALKLAMYKQKESDIRDRCATKDGKIGYLLEEIEKLAITIENIDINNMFQKNLLPMLEKSLQNYRDELELLQKQE